MSLIKIDFDKCVGCNSCVRVCPVFGANSARYNNEGKIVVDINDEKCINCGSCITACSHDARGYSDDIDAFFNDIKKNKDIVVIVAPAVKIAFDGNWRHVLQWLKNNGISKIYDVSFGADICTWAHIKYFEKNKDAKLISQPCAAIVNYVLKIKPELIKNLSPIHSPMLCLAIYLKKYLNVNCKIAALSPCIAKKDEFIQTGYIDYNVTFEYLKKYFKKENISFPQNKVHSEFEFDESQGYVGSIYSKPAGLKENLELYNSDIHILNSEGTEKVYQELENYSTQDREELPDVFDVLNCEFGCNSGPAVGQKYNSFKMDKIMNNVKKHAIKKYESQTILNKSNKLLNFSNKLKLNDFIREYIAYNKSQTNISKTDIENAFRTLNKTTEEDKNFDCHACGFKTCYEMATAIAMNINIPENCYQFINDKINKEQERLELINQNVIDLTKELSKIFSTLNTNIENTKNDSELIKNLGQKGLDEMTSISNGISELYELGVIILNKIKAINSDARNYKKITDNIEEISQNINLLSFNASIEAARAGDYGKGFSVIASNIRSLSDNSRKTVQGANNNNININKAIDDINKIITEFNLKITKLVSLIDNTIKDVKETSENSEVINQSMSHVMELSNKVYNLIEKTNNILLQ